MLTAGPRGGIGGWGLQDTVPPASAHPSPQELYGETFFPVFLSHDRSWGLGWDRSWLSSHRAEYGFRLKCWVASGGKGSLDQAARLAVVGLARG